jgi:glycerol kinase
MFLLSIDQGTTSSRAIVYDAATFRVLGSAAEEITQHYPQSGWVEHDPEQIWQSVANVVPRAIVQSGIDPQRIAAIGITNQRETIILWERSTGKPIGRAIVWQDRRTTDFCRDRAADRAWLQQQTGLVLDPYFSATKIRWKLQQDPQLRERAERGEVICGTVDSFLIWRLTGGAIHATDVTNASRTLLANLHTLTWDEALCRYFHVPKAMLPAIQPSVGDFGATKGLSWLPDGITIRGVAGDQQSALFGQGAFQAGEAKCTYGTGAFFLLHTGSTPVFSTHQLLTTTAAMTGVQRCYALEGSVFVAGAAVQWLRDGLHLFSKSADVEKLVQQSDLSEQVIFVPAFVGLGAPYWVPEARGAILGLNRSTTAADIARAALEGVAFQVADLIEAARKDRGAALTALRVDGGMARNDGFLQFQADILDIPILFSGQSETTALGAAFLAGIGSGLWKNEAALQQWVTIAKQYQPKLAQAERDTRLRRWRKAIDAVLKMYEP